MKKSVFLLAFGVLGFNIYAFDPAPALVPVGNVKDYTKTDYTITEKFGDYYRSPKAKYVHVFDENGRQTETSEFTGKDVPVDRIVYSYDEAGNLVSTTGFDADGKLNWKISATFDSKNRKTEESEFNAANVLVSKSIWKYNGSQSEEAYYNSDGALLGKIITKTDDNDRIIEVSSYISSGKLDNKRTYSYNDAGKVSEITYWNSEGNVSSRVVFRFDEKFTLTEVQTYSSTNKLVQRVIYKYDEKGNVLRTTTYAVSEKFGGTVNELTAINEFAFNYANSAEDAK